MTSTSTSSSASPTTATVHVDVARDGELAGVATLTLDDAPRKNALTEALGDRFREAVAALRADDSIRAVVVTGADGAFSAGGDLAMLEHLRTVSFDAARAHMLAFYARYLSLLDLEVPTIAAVRGPAIGAGLCVACACDLVVVAHDSKLAFNFTSLGLHPGMGATALVPRKVGAQRAAELLFTGRRFDGAEALRIGLAVDAVDDTQVLPRARALATAIARQGPLAVRDLKKNLGVDRVALHAALEREADAQARSYASADLAEGLAAARERRGPRFGAALR
jgi:enoyl-CoA hydratase/carnithine racemase